LLCATNFLNRSACWVIVTSDLINTKVSCKNGKISAFLAEKSRFF